MQPLCFAAVLGIARCLPYELPSRLAIPYDIDSRAPLTGRDKLEGQQDKPCNQMRMHHAQRRAADEMCQARRSLELHKRGLDTPSLGAGEEDRKDLPMPEEKLQQYHPVLPGKVLYICRFVAS